MLSQICLVLLSLLSVTNAVTYYVSSSRGNDLLSGTSPANAWQSFRRLNPILTRLQPGDNIFFCQGDTFPGVTLMAMARGTEDRPITWGSYKCADSTAKPILTPAVIPHPLGWRAQGDALVQNMRFDVTMLQQGIRAIYINDVRHLAARWPNLRNISDARLSSESEFLFNTPSSVTNNRLTHPSLTQPNNYWIGAAVYMRTSNWLYQLSRVVASGNGWIQVEGAPSRVSGFYLEQSVNPQLYSSSPLLAADMPGEFDFDMVSGSLRIYPATQAIKDAMLAGDMPVYVVYGQSLDGAIINQQYNIIQDLEFRYTASGIFNNQRGKFTARRNTISHASGWGITSGSAAGSVVEDNKIYDVEADCIKLDSQGGIIQNNVVDGCGMYAGYGFGYGAASTGIVSMNSDVVGNVIKNTGYSGITPHAVRRVRFNYIKGAMRTLNDGGGIYMFGSLGTATVLEGNIIEQVEGHYLPWTTWNIASCIFTDQGTSYISVYNNSCVQSPQCMQLNSAKGNMLMSNRCDSPGIYINDFVGNVQTDASTVGNHGVVANAIITRGTNSNLQNPIYRIKSPSASNLAPVATFFYNRYCKESRPFPAGTPAQFVSNTDYLFQTDFGSNGGGRMSDFQVWRQRECGRSDASRLYPSTQSPDGCSFEQDSFFRYDGCDNVNPWLYGADFDHLQAWGYQLLEEERSAYLQQVIGGCVGGAVGLLFIVAAVILYVRRNKESILTLPTALPLSTSSACSSSLSSPAFHTMDSPSGEFELVVTPEMKRGFSWSDSSVQAVSQ